MSDEMKTPQTDETEVTTEVAAAPVVSAESFIQQELADARKALRNVQIIGSILILVLAVYLGYITSGFLYNLRPDIFVQNVSGFVSGQIDSHRGAFVDEVGTRVPEMIQQAPDLALAQLKSYREQAEDRLEGELKSFCTANSEKLNASLEDYIVKNKEQIKTVLDMGKDPKGAAALGAALHHEVLAYLKVKSADGKSIDGEIQDSLKQLKDADQRLHRLATAKDLNPTELKTRRAVAIIADTIAIEQLKPLNLPKLGLTPDENDTAE
ncbi:MAG TPA: hypothetical protein VGM23_07300 [Armatimonadota bacterium]|jgi:hypothetical protein